MTDAELLSIYQTGCGDNQAAGLRAVFDAGIASVGAGDPKDGFGPFKATPDPLPNEMKTSPEEQNGKPGTE